MNANINTNYWLSPPWQAGGRKHRMGLQPDTRSPVSAATPPTSANKRLQLEHNYSGVVSAVPGSETRQQQLCEMAVFNNIGSEHPDLIANAALTVEEDLCLMQISSDIQLVAACVCAPSYWRLRDKIGMPLTDIHEPVDGMNARIGDNITRFFNNMPEAQTFRRCNWFVHGDAELYHPAPEDFSQYAANQWTLRSEYQTLYKLNPDLVLFAIRIVCEPLAHIAEFPQAAHSLIRALSDLNTDEVNHFGGADKRTRLLHYLAGLLSNS